MGSGGISSSGEIVFSSWPNTRSQIPVVSLGDAGDLKTAMRAKDTVRLDAIRAVRAAITLREVDSQQDLDDQAVLELIRGLRKQRVEAIEAFSAGGRADLVEQHTREKELLEAYLPQTPKREVVERTVSKIIAELGVISVKDMGRVMQASKTQLSGADGKELSEVRLQVPRARHR